MLTKEKVKFYLHNTIFESGSLFEVQQNPAVTSTAIHTGYLFHTGNYSQK